MLGNFSLNWFYFVCAYCAIVRKNVIEQGCHKCFLLYRTYGLSVSYFKCSVPYNYEQLFIKLNDPSINCFGELKLI
jgi:hypothetical protein